MAEERGDDDWPWQWAGTSHPAQPAPPRTSGPIPRPRPVRRPAAPRPLARSVTPRPRPARERPSLGEPHGRQRILDVALLLLAVVVVVLAVLALQG